jgi:hypothetical protein
MHVRRIPTEKHMLAARLLLDGHTGFKALRAAGYSYWTSTRFGNVYENSFPLREAIRLESERRQAKLQARPAVKPKLYAGKSLVTAVETGKAYKRGPRKKLVAKHCPMCRGWLEGEDRYCVSCGRCFP